MAPSRRCRPSVAVRLSWRRLPVFFERQGIRQRVTTTRILAAGFLFATLAQWAGAAPQPYRMEDAPDWVSEAPDAQLLAPGAPVEAGQSDFPLVDHQIRLTDTTTYYRRFVERLVSQASVDDSAQISIDIDPERERILLHKVRVFRNGRAIDKLADARRSLLSREEDLAQGIINGRVTLHIAAAGRARRRRARLLVFDRAHGSHRRAAVLRVVEHAVERAGASPASCGCSGRQAASCTSWIQAACTSHARRARVNGSRPAGMAATSRRCRKRNRGRAGTSATHASSSASSASWNEVRAWALRRYEIPATA